SHGIDGDAPPGVAAPRGGSRSRLRRASPAAHFKEARRLRRGAGMTWFSAHRPHALCAAIATLVIAGCTKDNADRSPRAQNEAASASSVEPAAPEPGGSAPAATASAESAPAAEPLERDEPNVPEFSPAFAGQTRAPEARSQVQFEVQEIAGELEKPWAIAFLPDRRMLVTEKPTGKLFVVTPDGKKSPAVQGLPKVDGRDQGGLLDVEVAPDYAQSSLIYWSYYEPREGGNGLAVARAR